MVELAADMVVRYEGYAGQSRMATSELEWLIARLPRYGLFVEVGSASGVTAARVADALPNLDILCVDIFIDTDHPDVTSEEPDRVRNWRTNRRPRMNLFLGTVHDLKRAWQTCRADAVLIDADHSEASVRHDLDGAAAVVRRGGIILAHDTDHPSYPGVRPAVDSFCAAHGYTVAAQHMTLSLMTRTLP